MVSGCGLSLFGTVGGDPQDRELARSWLGLLHGGATTKSKAAKHEARITAVVVPKSSARFPPPSWGVAISGCADSIKLLVPSSVLWDRSAFSQTATKSSSGSWTV